MKDEITDINSLCHVIRERLVYVPEVRDSLHTRDADHDASWEFVAGVSGPTGGVQKSRPSHGACKAILRQFIYNLLNFVYLIPVQGLCRLYHQIDTMLRSA